MPTASRSATAVVSMLLALVFHTSAIEAQEDPFPQTLKEEAKPRVELFLSSLFANSATEGSFGIRGSWHRKRKLALEGSLSRIAAGSLDIFLIDFSAKYYLRDRRRTDVYLVGGPGAIFEGAFEGTEALVHFGIGLEVDLTRRLYLRPELRGRWFVEDVGRVNIGDLVLGLGWRL